VLAAGAVLVHPLPAADDAARPAVRPDHPALLVISGGRRQQSGPQAALTRDETAPSPAWGQPNIETLRVETVIATL